MSALVRLFALSGVSTAHVNAASGRYTTDSVPVFRLPYIARASVTATETAASTTTALTNNSATKLVLVQIQAGKTVAIESNPPNRTTEADTDSPYFSGEAVLECGLNWTFSIKEITVV